MSYDVSLNDEHGPVTVPRHTEGGSYVLGGLPYAELNITYNYAEHYYALFGGLRTLNGATGGSTIPTLEAAIDKLGVVRDPSYWAGTPGNAGFALSILLSWAHLHPDATWEVT